MDAREYRKFVETSGQQSLETIKGKLKLGWYDHMTLEVAKSLAYEDFIHSPLYRKLGPTYYKTAKRDLENYIEENYTDILLEGLSWKNL